MLNTTILFILLTQLFSFTAFSQYEDPNFKPESCEDYLLQELATNEEADYDYVDPDYIVEITPAEWNEDFIYFSSQENELWGQLDELTEKALEKVVKNNRTRVFHNTYDSGGKIYVVQENRCQKVLFHTTIR